MKDGRFRFPLTLCALALAVGCGPTPVSGVPSLLQTSPLSSSGSLLYVLDNFQGRKLSVFSFPSGAPQKQISMPAKGWAYMCSDPHGNVYVPTYNVIFKYAHGGQHPIAYLQDEGSFGAECAADPKTGNLLTNDGGGIKGCYVAVYLHAKGKPSCLTQLKVRIGYPTFDNNGDLFFAYANTTTSSLLGELPAGASKLVKIDLSQNIGDFFDLQWDGEDIAIQYKVPGSLDQPVVISRVHVLGTKGTIVKTIHFKGWTTQSQHFWISGSLVVAPLDFTDLGIWNYPTGGKSVASISMSNFEAWTVSVAP